MRDLLAIVPSMNRPGQLKRLIGTFYETRRARTDLAVVLDKPWKPLYANLPAGPFVLTHPAADAQPTTVKVNWAARQYVNEYDALMFLGDDHTCKTPAWDSILLDAIGDMGGTGIVYPKTERLPDLPEVWAESSDMVRTLGWLALPVVRHYFIDNAAKAIAEAIGRYRFVPEAVLPHHHWSMPAGMESRAERDECYDRAIGWFPADRIAWWLWQGGEGLEQAAAKLRPLVDDSAIAG